MAEPQVLIVGAGPTGLVLALWLTKAGVDVRIIDKAPHAGTSSRAVGVQARTLEFYRQLGISYPVVEAGVKAEAVNLWSRRKKVARVAFGDIGGDISPYPYLLIYPQDEHESLLENALEELGVTVERSVELLDVIQESDHVQARLRLEDGSASYERYAYVAGCDGAHSSVRKSLKIGFEGGTYEHLFYVADVKGTGPVADGEVHVSLGEDDFLAVFPMKREDHIRLIGSIRESALEEPRPLTWADADSRMLKQLSLNVSKVGWFSTYHVHHRVAPHFGNRRVFLLGDAAHVHSPVGGQGMNTGIGDAANLGWKLAEVLHGRSPADLLETYEVERASFARRLVATTDRAFSLVTDTGSFIDATRRLVLTTIGALSHFRAVRRFLFRTISQTSVKYPGSRLSRGSRGGLKGGDRLPWLRWDEYGTRIDNHTTLLTRSWQVHSYGAQTHTASSICATRNVVLCEFPWFPRMARAGVAKGAMFVIRPDGYIGLSTHESLNEELAAYLDEVVVPFEVQRSAGLAPPRRPSRLGAESLRSAKARHSVRLY